MVMLYDLADNQISRNLCEALSAGGYEDRCAKIATPRRAGGSLPRTKEERIQIKVLLRLRKEERLRSRRRRYGRAWCGAPDRT